MGDDLVVLGLSAPSGNAPVVIGDLMTSAQEVDAATLGVYAGRVSSNGSDAKWLSYFRTDATDPNFLTAGPFGVRGSDFVFSVFHLDQVPTMATTTVGMTPYKDLDSLWLSLGGGNGTPTGVLPWGAGLALKQIFFVEPSACGDLVFGDFLGDFIYQNELFSGGAGKGFVAFEPLPGVEFGNP